MGNETVQKNNGRADDVWKKQQAVILLLFHSLHFDNGYQFTSTISDSSPSLELFYSNKSDYDTSEEMILRISLAGYGEIP